MNLRVMQKIVTIGGGTGHFQILRGLKNYDCEITAIVNMADDGGSSGKLMDEYGILPPGDIRQCLVALADEKKGKFSGICLTIGLRKKKSIIWEILFSQH
jgi:2-phospho-L-lactate transferase/gluconeogenesis factor (CofD/UPF0052 family)